MKTTLLVLAASLLLFGGSGSQTLTGVITDTMCGAKHTMMKDQPDAACIRMCVKGPSEYALYDGKTVWQLSDQKAAAKFAAVKVTVVGATNDKTKKIKTASISEVH